MVRTGTVDRFASFFSHASLQKNVPIAPLTYRHGHFFIDGLSFEFMWYNGNEKIFPLTTEITESVYASAVVQPDCLYDVHAPVSGVLGSRGRYHTARRRTL